MLKPQSPVVTRLICLGALCLSALMAACSPGAQAWSGGGNDGTGGDDWGGGDDDPPVAPSKLSAAIDAIGDLSADLSEDGDAGSPQMYMPSFGGGSRRQGRGLGGARRGSVGPPGHGVAGNRALRGRFSPESKRT